MSLHLAPNAPWLLYVALTVALIALAVWAYRFAVPPLPALARRALPALRLAALVVLLWLLAQPVFETARGAGGRLVVLLDRSRSMELPERPGGAPRSATAERAARQLRRSWHGPSAQVAFAGRLGGDSTRTIESGATALGDALGELARSPDAQDIGAVVVVSDGVVNTGADPVDAARALGVPVHAVAVGTAGGSDRAIAGIDASAEAQVGRATPVRVRVVTTEPRGVAIPVVLRDGSRELGRATVISPGSGAEAVAEFRATPVRPGLAVWTASVDSLRGEITAANNSRQVAIEVAPSRLGVVMISSALNWDFAFLHRALVHDSSLAVSAFIRSASGWTAPERAHVGAPGPELLRGKSVVLLDGIAPRELSQAFDQALQAFVSGGGALIAIGGAPPGLARFHSGAFVNDLALRPGPGAGAADAPEPSPEGRELLQWDDDPVRGERAWNGSAPLGDVMPIAPSGADRVLLRAGKGPPLLMVRRIGRGQALLVNGSGLWRWSLSGTDELSGERARRLWRGFVHALAEPVQGEPLRVRPERWVTPAGEVVRLFATLQDEAFRPVAGATVEGELRDEAGRSRRVTFRAGSAGSYVAAVDDLPPGRWRASARAVRGGRELGRASSEFAVDRWSLEVARTLPDSATLASMAAASGGRATGADQLSSWTRSLETQRLGRTRTESHRLWESPWMFAVVIAALSVEWAWRRRRGLP